MAKRRNKLEKFQAELTALGQSFLGELHVPSMKEKRLEGFAHLYLIVLPLLSSEGHPVFTDPILEELFLLLDGRFGGCMLPSSSSHPPFWGHWHPPGEPKQGAQKDYLTTVQVLANPIDASTRFFAQLKQILKTAGNIEQQEILIYRMDCWLV